MQPSQQLYDTLNRLEGNKLTAYKDAGGWAIGRGHNGPDIQPGMTISQEKSDELFQQDIASAAAAVSSTIKVPLSQNQFDSLVSFAYNVGNGAFAKSTLAARLNRGDFGAVAGEMGRWINSEGKPNDVLVARRGEEAAMFTGGTYQQGMFATSRQAKSLEGPVSYEEAVKAIRDQVGDGTNINSPRGEHIDTKPVFNPLPAATGDDVIASAATAPAANTADKTFQNAKVQNDWAQSQTWGDAFRASYDGTWMASTINAFKNPSPPPDPNFNVLEALKPWESQIGDDDEVRDLLATRSQGEFQQVLGRISDQRNNQAVLTHGSQFNAFTAGFAAMATDPMTYLTGAGAIKAVKFAGLTGLAAASVGGAAGNIAYEGARAAVGQHVDFGDVVNAGVFGLGLGALGHGLGFFGAHVEEVRTARKAMQDALDAETTNRAMLYKQATDDLTEEASKLGITPQQAVTPQAIAARMAQYQANQADEVLRVLLAPVDENAKMFRIKEGEQFAPANLDRMDSVQRRVDAAIREGLGLRPQLDSGVAQAPVSMQDSIQELYSSSRRWMLDNPIDNARLENVVTRNPITGGEWIQSAAVKLLRSGNPVARKFASVIAENTTGAIRGRTAAMQKNWLLRQYTGDAPRQFTTMFDGWAAQRGVNTLQRHFNGEHLNNFNLEVAREIEARRLGTASNQDTFVSRAADILEAQYEIMRVHQVRAQVSGYANMPDSSHGYMPWKLDSKKYLALSNAQRDTVAATMRDELMRTMDWSEELATDVARTYYRRALDRSLGGGQVGINPYGETTAGVVQDALIASGRTADEITGELERFSRAGAQYTKTRLTRDLQTEIAPGMTLGDLMDVDHIRLLKRQADRVSGEVALHQFGIPGRRGLSVILESLKYGSDAGQSVRVAASRLSREVLDARLEAIANHLGLERIDLPPGQMAGSFYRTGPNRAVALARDPLREEMIRWGASDLQVKAHELGHALDHNWGWLENDLNNLPRADRNALLQELRANSEDYMPVIWQEANAHADTPVELIGTGLASLITDADRPLPLFRQLIGERRMAELTNTMDAGAPQALGTHQTLNVAEKLTKDQVMAAHQIAAEMLGEPIGDATPRFLSDVMAATSLVRLGGMSFAQLGEAMNALPALGSAFLLKGPTQFGRLLREVRDLKAGRVLPDDSFLRDFERFHGAVGSDHYRMEGLSPIYETSMPNYGAETPGIVSRMLQGGIHLQGKLSFWRAIHSVQQRWVTEGIIHRMGQYIRDGVEDAALRDMGVSERLQAAVRADLHSVFKFDSRGRVEQFLPSQGTNPADMNELLQAINRGAAQIIQEKFVGEAGKWAHSSWLKAATQFRSFPLVATEKQMVRQFANVGAARAFGYMLGAMSVMVPIQAGRVYVNSLGMSREKAQQYRERQLSPVSLFSTVMGYAAMAGIAGDMVNAGVTALGWGQARTGGQSFVSQIVPAAGLAEDSIKAVRNVLPHTDADGNWQGGDFSKVAKVAPFGRLPYLVPFFNLMTKD